MWPIEVIRAINNPKKAKTAKQRRLIKEFRETVGFTIKCDTPKHK